MPETLDGAARRLAVHLRRMKDRSGLSVPALAARTASSAGAWEQYLNGVRIPPRDAVEVLGQLSGADYDRLMALWELADRGVADTMKGFPYADPLDPLAPVEGMPRHALRRRRKALLVVAGGLVLGGVFALLVATGVATDGAGRAQAPPAARPTATVPAGPAPSASGSAGSAVTSWPGSAPAAEAKDATGVTASRTAGAMSPDGGTPAAQVAQTGAVSSAPGRGPHTAAPGTGGTTTAAPGGGAPTTKAPPPATSAPAAPAPSASPSRSPGKGLCLGLIILGICIG
ncbi:helix-turn-helix domain-containing protein [Actinacidiphila glaucinigra]|uniref:helix-turn-helix domain-containing protein n=1 Tax=Actinacidiphila glaucinigra TaxID=235986 RepID=UPI0015C5A119|nr:helix-turn-helix transcriptional regulator [Actinacidiphila glaucinigra]